VSAVDKVSKADPKNQGNHNNGLSDLGRPVDYADYQRDLKLLEEKLTSGMDATYAEKLHEIEQRLVDVRKKKKQSINHSAMILVVSKHLVIRRYKVEVEHDLGDGLVCDIYAYRPAGGQGTKPTKDFIMEIETGYVGPEYAIDPNKFLKARAARKIESYSQYSKKFFIGTPPHNIVYIPEMFLKPREKRTEAEIKYWNGLCAEYYKNPSLDFNNSKGHIEGLYVINVDSGGVQSMDVNSYMKKYPLVTRFPSWKRF